MSRKVHILLLEGAGNFNNRHPLALSDVSWNLEDVVLVVAHLLLSLISLECIPIAIKWTGFTKNNHLSSGMKFGNYFYMNNHFCTKQRGR